MEFAEVVKTSKHENIITNAVEKIKPILNGMTPDQIEEVFREINGIIRSLTPVVF